MRVLVVGAGGVGQCDRGRGRTRRRGSTTSSSPTSTPTARLARVADLDRDALRGARPRRLRRGARSPTSPRAERVDVIVNACDPRLEPADLRRGVRRGLSLHRHGDDPLGAASGAPVRAARAACSARSSSRPPTAGGSAGCSRSSGWAWSPGSPTCSRATPPITCSRDDRRDRRARRRRPRRRGVRLRADVLDLDDHRGVPQPAARVGARPRLLHAAAVLGAGDLRVPRGHRPDRVRARGARGSAADPEAGRLPAGDVQVRARRRVHRRAADAAQDRAVVDHAGARPRRGGLAA